MKLPKMKVGDNFSRKIRYFIVEKDIEILEDREWQDTYISIATKNFSVSDCSDYHQELLKHKEQCSKRGGSCILGDVELSMRILNDEGLITQIKGTLSQDKDRIIGEPFSVEGFKFLFSKFSTKDVEKMLPRDEFFHKYYYLALQQETVGRFQQHKNEYLTSLSDKSEKLTRSLYDSNITEAISILEQLKHINDQEINRCLSTEELAPLAIAQLRKDSRLYECLQFMLKGIFENRKEHFETSYSAIQEVSSVIPTIHYPFSLLCEAWMKDDPQFLEKQFDSIVRAVIPMEQHFQKDGMNMLEMATHAVFGKSVANLVGKNPQLKEPFDEFVKKINDMKKQRKTLQKDSSQSRTGQQPV